MSNEYDDSRVWSQAELGRCEKAWSELVQYQKEKKDLTQLLTDEGYENIREVDGMVCATMRFLFTVGVCYGIDRTGYRGRFCFDTYQNAELFLKEWDGKTLPVIGDDGCTAIK